MMKKLLLVVVLTSGCAAMPPAGPQRPTVILPPASRTGRPIPRPQPQGRR